MKQNKYLAQLKKDPSDYVLIPDKIKTASFNLKFIKINPWGIRYIEENKRTKQLCFEAINLDPETFEYYPNNKKTYNLCFKMVSINGSFIRLVPEKFRNHKLVRRALVNNGLAIGYLSPQEQTEEYKTIAVYENPDAIQHISFPTTKLKEIALCRKGMTLRNIDIYPREKFLIYKALKQDGRALEFVKDQNHEMCLMAIKSKDQAYQFVKIVPNPNKEDTIKNLKQDFLRKKEISKNKKIVKTTISMIS